MTSIMFTGVILILFSTTAVLSIEISISPPDPELTKRHGDGMVLMCSLIDATVNAGVSFQWFNPQNQEVTNTNNEENVYIEAGANTLSLYVDEVRKNHAGSWTCKTLIGTETFTKSIRISTWKPITFINPRKLQQPVLGTTYLIECKVESEPIATVKWTIKGQAYTGVGDRYTQETTGLKVKNITEADNGMYQCQAQITEKASQKILHIRISVAVPPKLVKPPMITDPVAGTNLTIRCEATGKPKPTYKFFKVHGSDVEIHQSSRITVNGEDGVMVIRNLGKADSSIYKCTATNLGGMADSTVVINVQVPPTILTLKDAKADSDSMTELTCTAEGTPAPDLTWAAADNGRVFPVNSGSVEGPSVFITQTNVDGQSEAKLRFQSLKPEDMGNYTCMASNNVPPTASATVRLTVRYPPNFGKTPVATAYNWAGANRNISCTAYGYPAPLIKWYFKEEPKALTDNLIYSIDAGAVEETEVTSYLTVKLNSGNEDSLYGNYKCVATNRRGEAPHTITMVKATAPGPPQVSQPDIGSTRITLSISLPGNNGGVPVQGYRVVYGVNVPNSRDTTLDLNIDRNRIRDDESTPRTVAKIDGLLPNTKYSVSVSAKNDVNYGEPHVMHLQTRPITVPGPVEIKSGSNSISPTQYKFTWDKPDTGGLPLKKYIVNIRQVTVNETTNKIMDIGTGYDPVIVPPVHTSHTLTNLSPNQTYQITIVAVNAKGQSISRFIIVKTSAGERIGGVSGCVSLHWTSVTLPAIAVGIAISLVSISTVAGNCMPV